MSKSSIFAIVAFSLMSFFLYQGLYNDPKKVESPLIGKEFPKFKLNDLFLNTSHDNDSFQDRRTIINVWASWCLECEREHSHLIALSNNKNFDLVGINYKDNADDAKGWLNMRGNPYRIIIADFSGVLVMPPNEAEDDIDWALEKQKGEPSSHKKMLAGEFIGDLSGASKKVNLKSS